MQLCHQYLNSHLFYWSFTFTLSCYPQNTIYIKTAFIRWKYLLWIYANGDCVPTVVLQHNSEIQNHRTSQVGRTLRRAAISAPAQSNQNAKFDQFSEGLVHSSVESFQGWRFHNLSWKPVPMFDRSLGENVFLIRNWNVPCPALCLLPHILLLCTSWEEFGPTFSPSTPLGGCRQN